MNFWDIFLPVFFALIAVDVVHFLINMYLTGRQMRKLEQQGLGDLTGALGPQGMPLFFLDSNMNLAQDGYTPEVTASGSGDSRGHGQYL